MTHCFTHLATAFAIIILVAPVPTKAEIPFTHAKGVYEGTKDEYKHISPFWGMVALHGKMLKQIRFFGPYKKATKTIQDPDRPDLPARTITQDEAIDSNDQIAKLILALFPSPDGEQFVPNTRRDDAVGDLSRDLSKINGIIEILLSEKMKRAEKIKTITDHLRSGDASEAKKVRNNSFAKLLVLAYENQTVRANPEKPEKQLYPKNIVITSLLSFFVKVADHKSQLKELTFLMKDDFDAKSIFTTNEYIQHKKQGEQHLADIVQDQKKPRT